MQFSTLATIAFLAGSAMASYEANGTISYTTEIVQSYTTYCPAATNIVIGDSTYTVTEATTLTISDCPCTVVKPVSTETSVICHTCAPTGTGYPTTGPTSIPVYPTGVYPTSPGTTYIPGPVPTVGPPVSSGNKAIAMSGAALAGLLGFAAYIL